MSTLDPVERYLWLLSTAGYLFLYIRLRQEGLHRTYRFFGAYLLFRVARAVALAGIGPIGSVLAGNSSAGFGLDLYAWLWVATEPVLWVLYILVVLELYGLVLHSYKGIASLGRWAIFAGLAIALAISSLTLAADLSNPGEKYRIILYASAGDRGVASSLVIFLLLITAFLSWYPVPLSRNIVVHSIAYAVYFLSSTLAILMRNVSGGDQVKYANIVLSAMSIVCLAVWICFLNRKGEARTVRVRQQWRPADEQHLMEQLDAINSTLLRAARK